MRRRRWRRRRRSRSRRTYKDINCPGRGTRVVWKVGEEFIELRTEYMRVGVRSAWKRYQVLRNETSNK
jgi:hypothetical protein